MRGRSRFQPGTMAAAWRHVSELAAAPLMPATYPAALGLLAARSLAPGSLGTLSLAEAP
ncbi:hypothetical protein [Arthrobacter sp. M4]|uniref:hypothetical protein n=1 Tax=Arthrobacter sp. M4 TaxID=218160 RepID=UPI001CDBDE29|nr:hypothetical protein [Arthrobacter sp. M4]MCA4134341.1 hypothetical protein [Arthrobacter sp. M4]